jgi:cathepsin A (carboxypeptidase C)
MVGNLMEIGPCTFQHDNKTAQLNEYSWSNNANLLFLDQPLGTGFSVSSESDYEIDNAQQASVHAFEFLLQWYELYPHFKKNKLHIFGESYAGHYIPLISDLILDYNNDPKFEFKVPLTSIGIGNGIVDYLTQFKYFPQIACNSEKGQLYNNTICDQMQRDWPECELRVKECHRTKDSNTCFEAGQFCSSKIGFPNNQKKFSHYDISKECSTPESCYAEIVNIENWLNLNSTRELLGIKNTEFIPFQTCNSNLNMKFVLTGDNARPTHSSVSKLLENNIRVLIYAGDLDYICNYLGNRAWTLSLPWKGQSDFRKLKEEYWYNSNNGDLAGQVRQSDLLTYVRGFKGGHMYPSDQKENAYDLVSRWLNNESLIGK